MGVRDGDRVTRCGQGHLHWGRYGAAGLLPYHDGKVLLQRRAWWTPGGNTWGMFGGARGRDEDPVAAALRETAEESTLAPETVRVHGILAEDHGAWAYHTVFGTVPEWVEVRAASSETGAVGWFGVSEVDGLPLFGPFARTWPGLKDGLRRPVLIVDCANVMGARADGWWRDRKGAASRLRDELGALTGLRNLAPFDVAQPEIVLVVEGQARGIGCGATTIRVVAAPRSGDDMIVELVSAADPDARCLVVTADRELRGRSAAEGAEVLGPRWLLAQLSRE